MFEGRQPAGTKGFEHGSRGMYSGGSRYQATLSEDPEVVVLAVGNCKVCGLLAVACFKIAINPITNPNPVCSF
jgi:hypothetical protein